MPPSFAIIAAGALGTYYGSRLVQHGSEVHFLLRSDYAGAKYNGFNIHSTKGDFTLAPSQLHLYNDVAQMPKVDVVVVTLKTTSNDSYESLIRPLLHDTTAILTLQNGLGNEERLAALFGKERILGGLCFTCINRLAPGEVAHLAHGLIKMGEFSSGPTDRTHHIAEIFRASKIDCDVLESLKFGRWEKLVWNIPFNGLSASLDLTTDRILAIPQGVELVRSIMRDVITAAAADGVTLPESLIEFNIERTPRMGAYRTSMHIDRTAGRAMEVESILGEPARIAARARVSTPHLQQLYAQMAMLAASQNAADNAIGPSGR